MLYQKCLRPHLFTYSGGILCNVINDHTLTVKMKVNVSGSHYF